MKTININCYPKNAAVNNDSRIFNIGKTKFWYTPTGNGIIRQDFQEDVDTDELQEVSKRMNIFNDFSDIDCITIGFKASTKINKDLIKTIANIFSEGIESSDAISTENQQISLFYYSKD